MNIIKAYTDGLALTESMLDNFRDGIMDHFNTTRMGANDFDFSATSLNDGHFTAHIARSSESEFSFGDNLDGVILVNSSSELHIRNDSTSSSARIVLMPNETEYLGFTSSSLRLGAEVILGSGQSSYGLAYILSRYRKPVLVYSSATVITIENNTGTANETLICLPSRTLAVSEDVSGGTGKFRRCSLATTANGYVSTHTGVAASGLRSGLSLGGNQWLYVYGVRVRYGTDAGNNFIMVVDDTSPSQANEATLNTRYGSNEWVYLGTIRYGYGSTGSSTSIIPFQMSNKGWTRFYGVAATGNGAGLVLFQSTSSTASSPAYTVSIGNGSTDISEVVSMGQFNILRMTHSINGEFRDSADNSLLNAPSQDQTSYSHPSGWVVTAGIETGQDFTITHPFSASADKRVLLTAFADKYQHSRRQGFGV